MHSTGQLEIAVYGAAWADGRSVFAHGETAAPPLGANEKVCMCICSYRYAFGFEGFDGGKDPRGNTRHVHK